MLTNINHLVSSIISKNICLQIRFKSKYCFNNIKKTQLSPYFSKEDNNSIFHVMKHVNQLSNNKRVELFNMVKKAGKNPNYIPNFNIDSMKYYTIYTLMAIEDVGFNNWRKTCLKISFDTYSIFQYRHTINCIPKYKMFQIVINRPDCIQLSKELNNVKTKVGSRIKTVFELIEV